MPRAVEFSILSDVWPTLKAPLTWHSLHKAISVFKKMPEREGETEERSTANDDERLMMRR
jgi:hypothetical protein